MDKRLFSDETLYCEGLFKPKLRGKIHLLTLIIFPFACWHLYQGAGGLTYAFFISAVNLLGNLFCFTTSALYHVFDWPLEKEIKMQKWDHYSISLWSIGMMFPVAFLLFPRKNGKIFITVTIIACIINCICIYMSKPSLFFSCLVPSSILLFVNLCYKYMTTKEFLLMVGVFISQGLGVYILTSKIDFKFFNSAIFGYHEFFHVMTLIAAFFIYQISYSAASRYKEIKHNEDEEDTNVNAIADAIK
jgi:hemolysin III